MNEHTRFMLQPPVKRRLDSRPIEKRDRERERESRRVIYKVGK